MNEKPGLGDDDQTRHAPALSPPPVAPTKQDGRPSTDDSIAGVLRSSGERQNVNGLWRGSPADNPTSLSLIKQLHGDPDGSTEPLNCLTNNRLRAISLPPGEQKIEILALGSRGLRHRLVSPCQLQ